MTENEAIKNFQQELKEPLSPFSITMCNMAIQALEEIQAYRAIGTVEEIRKKMEELERWHTEKINENIKNPFAYTSTLICHNCDHKDDYIEELEAYVEECRAIGTIEEFKALKEKSVEKKPIRSDLCTCPSCGTHNEIIKKRKNTVTFDTVYCWHCGQAIEIKCD